MEECGKCFKDFSFEGLMQCCVVIHYGEIGIKGKNRSSFEKQLCNNILLKGKELFEDIKRESGQLILLLKKDSSFEKIKKVLERIPGIVYFSFAERVALSEEEIENVCLKIVEKKEFSSFKIHTIRHEKNNSFRSQELNKKLGALVLEKYPGKKVLMKYPDLVLKIEISHRFAYFSSEDHTGVSGLPVEEKQRVVALLSGGFDSPVASYLMMKRGCSVIFVHFHNEQLQSGAVRDKIEQLVQELSSFQNKSILYMLPFERLQESLLIHVPAEKRMLVYRRFMLRIASKIAEKEKASFLVTGDSLSQVASQTLENLSATYPVSSYPVLSPLIGMDKEEIITLAKKIGTYKISELPYGDCCSFLLAKHPSLRVKKEELENIEKNIDIEELVKDVLSKAILLCS